MDSKTRYIYYSLFQSRREEENGSEQMDGKEGSTPQLHCLGTKIPTPEMGLNVKLAMNFIYIQRLTFLLNSWLPEIIVLNPRLKQRKKIVLVPSLGGDNK